MRARLDAGTDVAMIGAWDARRDAETLANTLPPEILAVLEQEAVKGDLFLIHTGADGGGPVDVVVDEPLAPDEHARLRPLEGLRRLSVPSGVLRVAGVEQYRAPKPVATTAGDVTIPAGDYAVSAFVPRDPEAEEPSEAKLREEVGAGELRRYDRINLGVVMGGFAAPSLALLILVPAMGWKLAVPAAIAIFLAWFPATQWILRRSRSYTRLHAIATDFRLRRGSPTLVLALRRLDPGEKLAGGSVSIS
jgi:hypothetical protein